MIYESAKIVTAWMSAPRQHGHEMNSEARCLVYFFLSIIAVLHVTMTRIFE